MLLKYININCKLLRKANIYKFQVGSSREKKGPRRDQYTGDSKQKAPFLFLLSGEYTGVHCVLILYTLHIFQKYYFHSC